MTNWISLNHINFRTSIVLLVRKLLLVETGELFLFTLIRFIFSLGPRAIYLDFLTAEFSIFVLFILIKSIISAYFIFSWVNDYYELTPTSITHWRGIFFRRQQKYLFSQLKSLALDQSLLGKWWNYGTIVLFDQKLRGHFYLEFVHNPLKCLRILKALFPGINQEYLRTHTLKFYQNYQQIFPQRKLQLL